MTGLIDLLKKRRSVRKYTTENIPDDKLDLILRAGLLSASSRGKRPWEFIVVKNKDTLVKMAECRIGSAQMLKEANAAIVVIADSNVTDVWVEDCSICMANMHLTAASLDIGSCWIQGRLREAPTGETTEEYLRNLLGFPHNFKLEAILSLGIAEKAPAPYTDDDLLYSKIHNENF